MSTLMLAFICIFLSGLFSFNVNAKQFAHKYVGNWALDQCGGDITQRKDRIEFKEDNEGLVLTQIQMDGPQKTSVLRFNKDSYWNDYNESDTGNANRQLKRSLITKMIDGVPTVATSWSPRIPSSSREFLSSGIAKYEMEGEESLKVSWTMISATDEGLKSTTATCKYKKIK